MTQPTRRPWRAVQFETEKPSLIYSTEAGFALAHVDTEANARVIAASWACGSSFKGSIACTVTSRQQPCWSADPTLSSGGMS